MKHKIFLGHILADESMLKFLNEQGYDLQAIKELCKDSATLSLQQLYIRLVVGLAKDGPDKAYLHYTDDPTE